MPGKIRKTPLKKYRPVTIDQRRRLTDEDVLHLRRLRQEMPEVPLRVWAEKFDVHLRTVHAAISGETHKHLPLL